MWRLYYGDGATVDGVTRTEWISAPARNVVGLVQASERTGRSVQPADLFHWAPWMDRPFGVDQWGVIDHLIEIGEITQQKALNSIPAETLFSRGIKIGRMLNNDEWQVIWLRMVNDPGFPVKSNREATERVV